MIARVLCWFGFHDWKCLYRHRNINEAGWTMTELTGWMCFRCLASRTEQWDA